MTEDGKLKSELEEELEKVKEDLEAAKSRNEELEIKEDALETSIDGIGIADTEGRVTYANPAFAELWGYESWDELVGKNVKEVWSGSDEIEGIYHQVLEQGDYTGELETETKDGDPFYVKVRAHLIDNNHGPAQGIMAHFRDISERKELEEKLRQQARKDSLTGLYNQRGIDEILGEEMNRSQRHGHNLGLLLLDINKFKEINDQYGHLTGDYVLEDVAELLKRETREEDSVARYGGDEYLVLMPETGEGVSDAKDRLQRKVKDWNRNNDYDFPISLAIGQNHWSPGEEMDQALEEADDKMYAEKERMHKEVYHDSDKGYEAGEGQPTDKEDF